MSDKDLLSAIEKMEAEAQELERAKKARSRGPATPGALRPSEERDLRVSQKTRKQNQEDLQSLSSGFLFWGCLFGVLLMMFFSYSRETRTSIIEYIIYFVLCFGMYKAKTAKR